MTSLAINKSLIKEVQEWTYIFFVKFVKGSPLFVSKNNQEVKAMTERKNKKSLLDYLENDKNSSDLPPSDTSTIYNHDCVMAELEKYENISIGSSKQKRWASYIFTRAIWSWACDVCENRISMDKAIELASTKDSRYFIDNRKEWGYE